MQVLRCEPFRAECSDGGEPQWVDMSLVGEQPQGSWVLVFLGAAREVLDEERAVQITNALRAVTAVMQGEAGIEMDQLFADLLESEPQLPPHLINIKNGN